MTLAIERELPWIVSQTQEIPEGLDTRLGQIPGFSSQGLRLLIHYLCSSLEQPKYLEIGTFFGATLAMAMWKKQGVFIGVDNFSGFQGHSLVVNGKKEDRLVVERQSQRRSIQEILVIFGEGQGLFYEMDHLAVSPQLVLEKTGGVNVFFYDGDHSTQSTADGIQHFAPAFADEVIIVVDDYASGEVKHGVQWGLSRIPFKMLDELVCVGTNEALVCKMRRTG